MGQTQSATPMSYLPSAGPPRKGITLFYNPCMDPYPTRAVMTGLHLHLCWEHFSYLRTAPAPVVKAKLAELEIYLLPDLPRGEYEKLRKPLVYDPRSG